MDPENWTTSSATPDQQWLLVDPGHPQLSVRRQCQLLALCHSSWYYQGFPESAENVRLMRLLDEEGLQGRIGVSGGALDHGSSSKGLGTALILPADQNFQKRSVKLSEPKTVSFLIWDSVLVRSRGRHQLFRLAAEQLHSQPVVPFPALWSEARSPARLQFVDFLNRLGQPLLGLG